MDETRKVLGELLLNAVPTMILFAIVWGGYRLLVHIPLTAALKERHSKTQGAVAKAQADIAMAEAKTAEYEQRLREARAAIFKNQEAKRKMLLEARSAAVSDARRKAEERVNAARHELQRETASARISIQTQGDALAGEVIRAVLGPAQEAPAAGR